LICIAYADIID